MNDPSVPDRGSGPVSSDPSGGGASPSTGSSGAVSDSSTGSAPLGSAHAPDDTESLAPAGAGQDAPDDALPGGHVIHGGNNDDPGRAPDMVGPQVLTRAERRVAQRRAERSPIRATIRGIGQLLITAGLVVLLFVVYELWVTNLFGEAKQAAATSALDKLWAQESQDTVVDPDPAVVTAPGGVVVSTAAAPTADPGERARTYDTTEGAGFAKMYVPAFGPDFMFTVVEGTNQRDLYAGPGHYDKSQYPGQPGNFALAGHRVNKGAPFDDLGLLQSCDAVVIETQDDWYVYRVLPMKDEIATWADTVHAHCDGVDVQTGQYKGIYGQEITTPSDIAQVYPVPHVDNMAVPANAESLITLTTCHPKFSDRQRMIIHGVLTASYPKADGFLPPELQEAG